MNVHAVAPSLDVGQSRIFQMNAGAFVRDGDAYLVDPGIFPDEIDDLVSRVRDRGAHARGIIITHSHWDHVLGPERIPGVPVIAHSSVAAHLRQDRDEIARIIAERLREQGFAREPAFVAPQIDIAVDESFELPLGDGALRLLHAPGHCSDQIVIYETLERTLWAADMLSDLEIPFVEEVAAYRATLERLMPLDICINWSKGGHEWTIEAPDGTRLAEARWNWLEVPHDTYHLKILNTAMNPYFVVASVFSNVADRANVG